MNTDKKIKVLEAIRQGKIGGGESHVLDLSSNLNRSRFETIVLSFTDGPMIEKLNRMGIKTKVIHTEKAFDFKVWKKVADFIKEEEIDIVHAHGTRANSNVFRAAKKLKLPLIYTVHGWSFHIDQKFHVRKIREWSEKLLTNMANRTVCVSKSNENDGLKRFKMQRSRVIYNAVNLSRFNPKYIQPYVRNELGISDNIVLIGYIVRITAQKDPLNMIRAMKIVAEKAPDVKLLMVGDGDLKEKTIQLAKQLKISDKIIFQPFRTDIPEVLEAIDIYCLPSLWEGFPIGILEAMAMKKAVVASSVDGNKELIKNGVNGLLVEHSRPEQMAEAILYLVKDPHMRETLSEKAFQFVTNGFGINRMVIEVENEYNQLITNRLQH